MKKLLLLIFVLVYSMGTFAQADTPEDPKTRLQRQDMMGLNEGVFYYTHMKRGAIYDERARWEAHWLPITTKVSYDKRDKSIIFQFADHMSEGKYKIERIKIDFNLSGDGYLYYSGKYKGKLTRLVISPREVRVAMPDGSAFKLFK